MTTLSVLPHADLLAYIGPGAGFTFIGSFLILLSAVALVFVTLLTYPFRLLFGKIFRMLGADAVICTGYRGRFAYTPERCRAIANAARAPLHGMQPAMPVPAGGMKLERVDELVDFYGPDTILLIGGDLLIAGERLVERGREFAGKVAVKSRLPAT